MSGWLGKPHVILDVVVWAYCYLCCVGSLLKPPREPGLDLALFPTIKPSQIKFATLYV